MDKQWLVVHTKPKQEERAKENLERQGFETYLPLLREKKLYRGKWVYRTEPLFPHYLFLHLAMYEENIAPIRSTKGVHQLVRFNEYPAVIPLDSIESLKKNQNAELGCHELIRELKEGDSLEIIDGPFAGLIGKLHTASPDERVILMLDLLGRQSKVTLPMGAVMSVS